MDPTELDTAGPGPGPSMEIEADLMVQAPEEIADRAASVGQERLGRSLRDVFITAVIGGVEVSLGGLAAMCVVGAALTAAPRIGLFGALALGGLVFPVGLLFVFLGRSELFTENFLIPVIAVLTRERSPGSLVRGWVVTWLGNILGCALVAALLSVPHAIGAPIVHGYVAYTDYKLAVPVPGLFVSATLAGLVMTVLTWLMVAVKNAVARVLIIFAAGYPLFAANLSHTIIGAALLFAGFIPAHASALLLARWLLVATSGNLVGGVGFVTVLRVAQVREKRRVR